MTTLPDLLVDLDAEYGVLREVVGGLVGGDVQPQERITPSAEHLGLSRQQLNAVLDYYADFTTEIDEEIAENVAVADELEALWRRRQDPLAE